jgi:hypothetical protein
LIEACEILRPKYLVIPDVMGKYAESIEAAKKFTSNLPKDFNVPLMMVLQAEDPSEIRQGAREATHHAQIRAVSVPRIITKTLGTRVPVAIAAHQFSDLLTVHLLGFSDCLLDDVAAARLECVMGIDSAVPFRAALLGRYLTLDRNQEFGPRGNYWDVSYTTAFNYWPFIRTNLSLIRSWIGDN